jgi:uncharacterized damage-inducible protein DinB
MRLKGCLAMNSLHRSATCRISALLAVLLLGASVAPSVDKSVFAAGGAQDSKKEEKKPVTLKSVLLEQLRSTHTEKEWFVPINVAVQGVSADQANWTDGKGNHSVGQLTYHLYFWNKRVLEKIKGEQSSKFSGNNDETFTKFDAKSWASTVSDLNTVMADLEKAVESADEETLKKFASEIAHVGTHNAYHVGQIIYIRRLQGSWNPENGVK